MFMMILYFFFGHFGMWLRNSLAPIFFLQYGQGMESFGRVFMDRLCHKLLSESIALCA